MLAVLDLGNKQHLVEKDSVFFLDFFVSGAVGDRIRFKNLIFLDRNAGGVSADIKSDLSNVSVECELLSHFKSDKLIVFKKKKRKNYRRKLGHRQCMSKLKVINILIE